jgi:AcrR family transcriptional regulator
MSHREDLLEGAKRCLWEKGYARTTARDIVAASGTNLASIGYHFGSKEALLDAALIDAMSEMGSQLTRTTGGEAISTWEELASAWERARDEFANYRPLLVAMVEAWAQSERSPQLRAKLAEFYEADRSRGVDVIDRFYDVDPATARAISNVTLLLSDGLSLQWVVDPANAPTGREIALGLRAMADLLAPDSE